MPGDHLPATCPACAGFISRPPLDRCDEPHRHACPVCQGPLTEAPRLGCRESFRHQWPRPGKGFNPPYMRLVAEAVVDLTEDDGEEPGKDEPTWQD